MMQPGSYCPSFDKMKLDAMLNHIPPLSAPVPGRGLLDIIKPDQSSFIDVVDCIDLPSLDSEEHSEAVSAEGNRAGLYRVLATVNEPGDYAYNPQRRFDFLTDYTLQSANIYSLNKVANVTEQCQGGWSCFPACRPNDILEATWLIESRAHLDFLGHYCMLWPQKRPTATKSSTYKLSVHPDLELSFPLEGFVSDQSGWRTLVSCDKARVTTFACWSEVSRSVSCHFRKAFLPYAEQLHSLSKNVTSDSADKIASVKSFLSRTFERELRTGVFVSSLDHVIAEESGSNVDLTLLGAAMLANLGYEVMIGLTSSEWNVPGLWLDKPLVKINGNWTDLLDTKPGLDCKWLKTQILKINAFEVPGAELALIDRI